jgi:putative tryptophan/tyrosine transport system substrate-binding protein
MSTASDRVLDRRTFVVGGVAALAAPLGAEAQQAGKVFRIGYLFEQAQAQPVLRVHDQSLRELGYVEGTNLVVERRFAAFKYDRLGELSAELVRLKPDVIVTASNPVLTVALKQATTTVPIVFVGNVDPIGDGLVTSLARPAGNVTGLSLGTSPEFMAKQLEILKEIVPRVSLVGIVRQAGRLGIDNTAALERAARKHGLTLLFVNVRTPNDIEHAFVTMTRNGADACLILGGGLTYASRQRIGGLAVQHRLPAIHLFREYADSGLLLTYGPTLDALWRRAATYVDKILKGTKPGELPVEQPTAFELVINLKTAKALGLTIPPSLLLRADQVIE